MICYNLFNLVTILGPTASGKTNLAVNFAARHHGEIISADSRQVYLQLDIGSGKDLTEYRIGNQFIPYHLIDIHPVSYEYNLFEFQQDAYRAIKAIWNRRNLPVLCGGTGMYLQSVVQNYDLRTVPADPVYRQSLALKSDQELIQLLQSIKQLHNKTDTEKRERLIRALEIARFQQENPIPDPPAINTVVFGIHFNRQELKRRITDRLQARIDQGMIEEVEDLLKQGTDPERLNLLGLEYKLITQYLQGQIKNYNDFFQKLNASIHAFAKRQMTWFRKMEKDGIVIHWLDGNDTLPDKLKKMHTILESGS